MPTPEPLLTDPVAHRAADSAAHPAAQPTTDATSARERLLRHALALFASQGFAKTSTREIAEAAHTNVASISYYFGDKAGLYRAAFFAPLGTMPEGMVCGLQPGVTSLDEMLVMFFAGMLEPLKQGELARQSIKLRFREMIEPTGLWAEELSKDIAPSHAAMTAMLGQHLGLAQPDDEVDRLAIAISALAVHLHVCHDVIERVAPRLLPVPDALDGWMAQLLMYARAMVAAEVARRAALAPLVPPVHKSAPPSSDRVQRRSARATKP
jgi:AcrR family transcriptional regulator